MRPFALLAALVPLLLVPAPAQATDAPDPAWDGCVQYMYVADYHWYWICVAPRDLSCPVYLKEQHGVTVTKECVAGGPELESRPTCVWVGQDLDYTHYLCVDPFDPSCPVYAKRTDGSSTWRTCVTPLG